MTRQRRRGSPRSGGVCTKGIKSLWSMFKRGCIGTCHHMNRAHLGRYVNEFVARHKVREMGVEQQMEAIAGDIVGKRFHDDDLVAAGPVGIAAGPDRSELW